MLQTHPSYPLVRKGLPLRLTVSLCLVAALLPSCASKDKEAQAAPGAPMSGAPTPGLGQAARPSVGVPSTTAPSIVGGVKPSTAAASTDGIWFNSVPVDGPYVALTFDDGPSPSNTPTLLNVLRQHNVRATFYVVGKNVSAYPDIARRIVNEGHEIANHTWDHPKLTALSATNVESQFKRTHDVIVSTTGVAPRTMRPPYGAFTRAMAVTANEKFGYKTIMWDVDPMDWKNRNAALVESRIVSSARSGSIILVHDIHKTSVDAMNGTITKLKAAGYRFVTVSQLISLGNRTRLSLVEPPPTTPALSAVSESEAGKLAALAPKHSTVPAAPYQLPRLARETPAAPASPAASLIATLPPPHSLATVPSAAAGANYVRLVSHTATPN